MSVSLRRFLATAALVASTELVGCSVTPQAPAAGTGGQPASGGVPEVQPTGGILKPATGGVAPATGGVLAPADNLPCDVAEVVATYCGKCHGEPTNWGGPMPLTRRAHFFLSGKLTTGRTVHELASERINRPAGVVGVMPPTGEPALPPEALATLNTWLANGMPGSAETCEPIGGVMATGGATGTGGSTDWEFGESEVPSWPGGVKPKETCYQFLKHGGQTPDDTTPHMTETGETYVTFYHKVPWTEPVVATRWRTLYDQTNVLHHWLLYNTGALPAKDGQWASLSTDVITSGAHWEGGAELIAGWAVGGNDEQFPDGVGLKMAAPGRVLELEWHLYNTTGARVPDRSGIEICVVPESAVNPKFIAGLTWLGTEDLFIPPGQQTKRGGICAPSFRNGGGPLTIIEWLPHMHTLGTHMDTWIMRADGSEEHVFDEPFQFDRQISHVQNPPLRVNPGDTIHSVCTFNNPKSQAVVFGQSSNLEMCYQFVISYPIGSLEGSPPFNGVLTGATNGCGLLPNIMLEHAN